MRLLKKHRAALSLYFFYSCGLLFIALGFKEVLELTPILLLSTFGLVLLKFKSISIKLLVALAVVFVCTFTVEAIGVNTGYVFGEYTYLSNLGTQWLNTPLLIGINWILLTISAHHITAKTLKLPHSLQLVCAALLMVCWDLVIEPLAPALKFWSFDTGFGLHNSIGWFMLSLVSLWLWRKLSPRKENHLAVHVLLSQLLFFIPLYLIL